MIGIGVSLSSLRSSVSGTAVLSSYAIGGFEPTLVFDFVNEYYRTGGSVSTFDAAMTHARSGNATMVDSDGLLKWGPHNLITYSGDLTGADWSTAGTATIVDSETISFPADDASRVQSSGVSASAGPAHIIEFDYVSDGTFEVLARAGAVTQALNTASASATQTTHTLSIPAGSSAVTVLWLRRGSGFTATEVTVRNVRVYRSDLGGMVDNPDTGDSYVPTTTAARYLSRRGHHVWNGSAWVKEGMLVEPTAATNFVENSNNITTAYWSSIGGTKTSGITSTNPTADTVSRFFIGSFYNNIRLFSSLPRAPSGNSTFRFLAKADGLDWVKSRMDISGRFKGVYFDLANGVVGTVDPGCTATIEDWGDNWYLCSTTTSTEPEQYAGLSLAEADGGVNLIGYGGSLNDGILLTAFQWEDGSVPTSYIPTAGATATRAADVVTVPAANLPYDATNKSIQMDGTMTYADDDDGPLPSTQGGGGSAVFYLWKASFDNYLHSVLVTRSTRQGTVHFQQRSGSSLDSAELDFYNSGINVPFNIASRHGSTFINGAVDGTALTANLNPIGLPDLSATDLQLASAGGPMIISKFRVWADDLTDVGIAEASS